MIHLEILVILKSRFEISEVEHCDLPGVIDSISHNEDELKVNTTICISSTEIDIHDITTKYTNNFTYDKNRYLVSSSIVFD